MHTSDTAVKPADAIVAVDVGATWTRAALVDGLGQITGKRQVATPADGDRDALLAPLLALVDELLGDHPDAAPRAIGIASIGPLDAASGTITGRPPNVGEGWRGLPLGPAFADRYNLPCAVERDTNVSALGEHAFGAARGAEDFIYLTVSSGIGGAIFSRGRLLTGAHGVAGELGHIPVDFDGPVCGCGRRGCAEAIASGTALGSAGRAAVADGSWPDGPPHASARDVGAAAEAGTPAPQAIMARARAAFAAFAVGLVNAFDPPLIVVGGAVAVAEGDRLLDPARAAVKAYALGRAVQNVQIVPAALGPDNGLIGCLPLVGPENKE